MLSKNKIDKGLKGYIKEHLSKGYSKHAVKHVLVTHGYDGNYVDNLLRRHHQIQFVKVYAFFISLIFIISILSFNLFPKNQKSKITGYATQISSNDEGCCTSICQQTSRKECYGKFVEKKRCDELEDCNVGCCIDKEGYCLTNYLYGNCIVNNGTNVYKECSDIVFCRNITDKSYSSRLYNIKNKKGAGISTLKSNAGYHKSSFKIQYYLYDKTNVLSVSASIKDNGQVIDSIALYDDGFHNDGAKNDNLYGNNWLSSKLKDFDGFKKLIINIVIVYADGSQQEIENTQTIVVAGNKKCMPIFNEWNTDKNYSIIFAAQNYDEQNGYDKFENDVQSFVEILFSIGKFFENKDHFNVYRLEQALSYFNVPTLLSIVSNTCPSYNNKKDLVIIIDNKEDYCVMEDLRVARINPQVLFRNNITDADINKTFADFCSYAVTPKKLADEIIAFATPPKITVYTSDAIIYNTSIVNLSFSISALNYPMNYSVFFKNSSILSKVSEEEITESLILNLTNGTNPVLIRSIDKNKNKAFSPLLLNFTLE